MNKLYPKYSELLRQSGPWCTVYTGADTGTVDTLEATDVRPGNIRDALLAAGADKADVAAAEAAATPALGEPGAVTRYLLIRGGEVVVNELLPGQRVMPEQATVDSIPDLLPLFKHRPREFPYVVVEVGRDGGEIRLQHASRRGVAEEHRVEGETEDIKKVPTGGWSQHRYQHHTEDVWRRNTKEVAAEIDRVISASGAKLLVLAGDIRARVLVEDQLSEASKALLTVVDAHTRTGGADPEILTTQVEQRVAEVIAYAQRDVLEQLAVEEGQVNRQSATGIGAVTTALQQAQVRVLLLEDAALQDHPLLALDGAPWIATAGEQALDGQILGKVSAPAALLRAAVLTEAEVVIVPAGALPDGVHVAALLRWPTGPAMPTENPA